MASTNRHAIEISSNTRTSSSSCCCRSSRRLGAPAESPSDDFLCFVVPARVVTLALLRGRVQLRSVCSGSRPDREAIDPVTRSRPPSRSPGRVGQHLVRRTPSRRLPGGMLSVLRVRGLAADKRRHYGAPGGPSNRPVQPPFTAHLLHYCRSNAVFPWSESARPPGCDLRVRGSSPAFSSS